MIWTMNGITIYVLLLMDYSLCDASVLHAYVTPIFHSLSPPMKLERQLQLQCDVTAVPPIDVSQISWIFGQNGAYLSTSRKYTVYSEPATGIYRHIASILTINRITEDELGVYSCEARNSAGLFRQVSVRLVLEHDDTDDIMVQNVINTEVIKVPVHTHSSEFDHVIDSVKYHPTTSTSEANHAKTTPTLADIWTTTTQQVSYEINDRGNIFFLNDSVIETNTTYEDIYVALAVSHISMDFERLGIYGILTAAIFFLV